MKKLSESVWADIRNKSLGREVRKEFKLNDLSAKEFKEYIEDQYTVVSKIYKPFYIESTESVSIPICLYKKPEPDYLDYMKDLYICYGYGNHTLYVWNDINEDVFNTLKDNYKTHTYSGCDFTEFSPNDGGEVNNKFVIDVIDFLLKYVDSKCDSNTFKPLLTKKGINESVWGDIRKKSLGQEDRKEDEINHLNSQEFYTYLTHRYNVFDSPHNEIISYEPTSDIIQIPILYHTKKYKIKNDRKYKKIIYMQIWDMNSPDKFKLCISGDLMHDNNELSQKIDKEYWITYPNYFWANIIPRIPNSPSPGKLTNKFIVQMIDFILDDPKPYKPIIKIV